ncbi:hypothetical protein OG921_12980 [Aldersonia sp. NBC_00410]|uniref:hypothetical protein n=1 Tax=Aldersonia sp. NBC_00410 TaxID=2975954 RepID=UPI00224CAD6F|nr:hypothetical protein [Aldersonia sp. NBC_00410]MCX5044079.1 hypothetical protein [Aldersonia sp. NBC_00410]
MARKQTARTVVEGFLLRTRRVLAHSLIREQAAVMSKLHSGEFTLLVTVDRKTGDETHRIQAEYPPEEALESLASRVRPLILRKEPIYYEKALNALEEVVGADTLSDEIDLAWWHDYWRQVIDANLAAQAYWVETPSGSVTDRKLMYAWLYGDVIHAQSPTAPAIRDLDIDHRYYAAAPGIARICDRVIYTQIMMKGLIDSGLLVVDPEVLTSNVAVTTTRLDEPVRAFTAPIGTPVPGHPSPGGLAALDPAVWRSPGEDICELGGTAD